MLDLPEGFTVVEDYTKPKETNNLGLPEGFTVVEDYTKPKEPVSNTMPDNITTSVVDTVNNFIPDNITTSVVDTVNNFIPNNITSADNTSTMTPAQIDSSSTALDSIVNSTQEIPSQLGKGLQQFGTGVMSLAADARKVSPMNIAINILTEGKLSDPIADEIDNQVLASQNNIQEYKSKYKQDYGESPEVMNNFGVMLDLLANPTKAASVFKVTAASSFVQHFGLDSEYLPAIKKGLTDGVLAAVMYKGLDKLFNSRFIKESDNAKYNSLSNDGKAELYNILRYSKEKDIPLSNAIVRLGEENKLTDMSIFTQKDIKDWATSLDKKTLQGLDDIVSSLSGKGTKATALDLGKEMNTQFKNLRETYRNEENAAWDELSNLAKSDTTKFDMSSSIQSLIKDLDLSSATVSSFFKSTARKVDTSSSIELVSLRKDISIVNKQITLAKGSKKYLRKKLDTLKSKELSMLKNNKLYKDSFTIEEIIGMVRATNDKAFIKGANINIKDGNQAFAMDRIRETLLSKLDSIPQDFKGYDYIISTQRKASALSRERFNLFGSNDSGTNKGILLDTWFAGKSVSSKSTLADKDAIDLMLARKPKEFVSDIAAMDNLIKYGKFSKDTRDAIVAKYTKNSIGYDLNNFDTLFSEGKLNVKEISKNINNMLGTPDNRQAWAKLLGTKNITDLAAIKSLTDKIDRFIPADYNPSVLAELSKSNNIIGGAINALKIAKDFITIPLDKVTNRSTRLSSKLMRELNKDIGKSRKLFTNKSVPADAKYLNEEEFVAKYTNMSMDKAQQQEFVAGILNRPYDKYTTKVVTSVNGYKLVKSTDNNFIGIVDGSNKYISMLDVVDGGIENIAIREGYQGRGLSDTLLGLAEKQGMKFTGRLRFTEGSTKAIHRFFNNKDKSTFGSFDKVVEKLEDVKALYR